MFYRFFIYTIVGISLIAVPAMARAIETPVKFLEHYPFKQLSPAVEVAEGFSVYDGVLGDTPGAIHWGIDYVQRVNGQFVPFEVYAMHEGRAWQGTSPSWGNYVLIEKIASSRLRYYTLYGHLSDIPSYLPVRWRDFGLPISTGTFLGRTGTSGITNGIPQLHLELQKRDLVAGTWIRIDPYGVYDRVSSGRYIQPGSSLTTGLPHFWFSDTPLFAK